MKVLLDQLEMIIMLCSDTTHPIKDGGGDTLPNSDLYFVSY